MLIWVWESLNISLPECLSHGHISEKQYSAKYLQEKKEKRKKKKQIQTNHETGLKPQSRYLSFHIVIIVVDICTISIVCQATNSTPLTSLILRFSSRDVGNIIFLILYMRNLRITKVKWTAQSPISDMCQSQDSNHIYLIPKQEFLQALYHVASFPHVSTHCWLIILPILFQFIALIPASDPSMLVESGKLSELLLCPNIKNSKDWSLLVPLNK